MSDGVRVRVLLDAFGTRPMDRRVVEELQRAGVMVHKFRPMSGWKVWT